MDPPRVLSNHGLTQISFPGIVATMVRGWRAVLVLPVSMALVVAVAVLSQERSYVATATFMPQGADNRASGTAALAQQFGIAIGGDRLGESPQFYVDLVRTRAVLRAAVETEYEFRDSNGRHRRATLVELYDVHDNPGGLPAWDLAVGTLRHGLSTSISNTGIVQISLSARHPELAEQVVARLLDLLDDFNAAVRRGRAHEEERFVADRVRDAQDELVAAEDRLGEFLRQNRTFEGSPELLFQHARLVRQVGIHQDVYTSLLRARAESRIAALRDTPLITVIDDPAGSARPQPRGTVTRTILAFALGVVIAILLVIVGDYVRRTRSVDDPRYRELESAARTAWQDLKQPTRWLGRNREKAAAGDH
jgi:uncharacterized protein involved in exopolysaccharide biosynthesis